MKDVYITKGFSVYLTKTRPCKRVRRWLRHWEQLRDRLRFRHRMCLSRAVWLRHRRLIRNQRQQRELSSLIGPRWLKLSRGLQGYRLRRWSRFRRPSEISWRRRPLRRRLLIRPTTRRPFLIMKTPTRLHPFCCSVQVDRPFFLNRKSPVSTTTTTRTTTPYHLTLLLTKLLQRQRLHHLLRRLSKMRVLVKLKRQLLALIRHRLMLRRLLLVLRRLWRLIQKLKP